MPLAAGAFFKPLLTSVFGCVVTHLTINDNLDRVNQLLNTDAKMQHILKLGGSSQSSYIRGSGIIPPLRRNCGWQWLGPWQSYLFK